MSSWPSSTCLSSMPSRPSSLAASPVTDLASAAAAAEALSQRFPAVVVTAGGDGVAGGQGAEPVVTFLRFL